MDFSQFKAAFPIQLDPQQEAAVQAVDGPILLLAVPGSGKTTVLVARIGYMLYVRGIPAENILTMTYTVSAARDMRQRFVTFFGEEKSQKLEFRTINGVCSRIIYLYERTMGRTAFRLMDDPKERRLLLSELCREQSKEYATESTLNALETAITYAKNQMLTEEELDQVKVEGVEFQPLFQAYSQALRERRAMDYDDQMVYALQILRQYPHILDILQHQYQYFCVDEAQDTSKIQHTIIRLLSGKSRNLFMVGDEDQSIYSFRAAYPQALTQFEANYPHARVLYMEQNYRSTKEIVAAADAFIRKNKNRHAKRMKAVRGSGPAVREIAVYDRQTQYQYLCQVARTCTEETAVLYRDNDSALPLIDRLDREGIPYRSRQVNSAFFTNRVVRDITDIIHLSQDPSDGQSFLNVYYKLGAGISKVLAQEAVRESARTGEPVLLCVSESPRISPWSKTQCRALSTHLQNMWEETADKAIYRIVHYMGYGEYLESRGMDTTRADILEALGASQPSPRALLDRLDQLKEVVEAGSSGGENCPFVLSTIHSSKGLEYQRVILMDVMDGLLPCMPPESCVSQEEKDTYEEERRLFYVGMTRARQELSIFTFKKLGVRSVFSGEVFPKKKASVFNPVRKAAPKPVPKKNVASRDRVSEISQRCQEGTWVHHKAFGRGQIVNRSGDIAQINFVNDRSRTLVLSVAIRSKQLTIT